ncbi:MAG: helix-turn-helix domain-containing protein [Alloprevotella sp.]
MEPIGITIKQLKAQMSSHAVCFRNDLIISDHVEQLELFQHSCRMCATLVLFSLGGEVDFSINLKRYRLTSDTLVVALAGDIVRIHSVQAPEAYAILISSDYLEDLQIDFTLRTGFFINIRDNAVIHLPHEELTAIAPYYPLLKRNMLGNHPENAEVLRGLVNAFSYTVISFMRTYCERNEEPKRGMGTRKQWIFNKFMELLKQHHCSERRVSFYAEKMCLTPNHLSCVLKEYSGKNATEWIDEYVVLEARIMLTNTKMTIQEIAYRLNFLTQSAFGKYFKLHTRVSPRHYRLTFGTIE